MTTVAVKDGVIAADSLVKHDVTYKGRKLFRTKRGVIGVAGALGEGEKFVEWYNDRRKKKPEYESSDEFSALVLRPDGLVELWDASMRGEVIDSGCLAIGSGAEYAMGAMLAGASAADAVAIACIMDPNTEGPITVEGPNEQMEVRR